MLLSVGCASRSEVNCSPKEIDTYVWEEEDSGAEKAGLVHQWPDRKWMEMETVSRGEGVKDLGTEDCFW